MRVSRWQRQNSHPYLPQSRSDLFPIRHTPSIKKAIPRPCREKKWVLTLVIKMETLQYENSGFRMWNDPK